MVLDLKNDSRVNSFATGSDLSSLSLRPTSRIEITRDDDYRIHMFMPDGKIYKIYCNSIDGAESLFNEMDLLLTYDKRTHPQYFI